MARMLFGNTVNRTMLNVPTMQHSVGLAAVAQRKLWLAEAGDAVVTASRIPVPFVNYVTGMTHTPIDSLSIFSADCACTTPVPEAEGLDSLLADYVSEHSPELCPYALDEATWNIVKRLDVSVEGYGANLPIAKVRQAMEWNRKSAFRDMAAQLNFPVAPGRCCHGQQEVYDAVRELKASYWPLLLKLDRSSNGFGSLVLKDPSTVEQELRAHFDKFKTQGDVYVVEAFLDFCQAPSVEAFVDDENVRITYVCDQLCNGPAFRGIVTPPPNVASHVVADMLRTAETVGLFLQDSGYRGHFDLDAGVTTEGELFFTEANIRRTAGTALHELVVRLAGDHYLQNRIWLADAQPATRFGEFSEAIEAIASAGMNYSPSKNCGVLLPAFTLPLDSQWRYLIIGEDWGAVQEYEDRLSSLLGFKPGKHWAPQADWVASKPSFQSSRNATVVKAGTENQMSVNILESSLLNGTGAAQGPVSGVQTKYRKLGNTGFDVSTIGFGTWQLGGGRWHSGEIAEGVRLLRSAHERGVNIFDAAVVYGQYRDDMSYLQSRSQELLGHAFSEMREKVYYCIKVGQYDERSHRAFYEPGRMIDQIQQSLRRLRTDYIDICLIHAPSLFEVRQGAAIAVLRTLQALGMVRAVGYSFESEPLHADAAIQQVVDVIMLQYNLLEPQCGPAIRKAGERGVGILVGGPYKRGYLCGRYRDASDLPRDDDYWMWNLQRNPGKVSHILAQSKALLDECGSGEQLRKKALDCILSEEAVGSAIIGHRSMEEVYENIDLVAGL